MIFVIPTGSCNVLANIPFYLSKNNLKCISTSLETININLLQNMFNNSGMLTITKNAQYDITFQFAPSDIGYTGDGTIGLTYTDVMNAKNYSIGQISFSNGTTTLLKRSLYLTTNVNISVYLILPNSGVYTFILSPLSYLRCDISNLPRAVSVGTYQFLQSNPVILTGTVTSGFKVTFYATYDSTTTGLAIFNNEITAAFASPMATSSTTSASKMLFANIDSISADLKTIVVNVGVGTVINTVLIGSQSTVVNPPSGTLVMLILYGS